MRIGCALDAHFHACNTRFSDHLRSLNSLLDRLVGEGSDQEKDEDKNPTPAGVLNYLAAAADDYEHALTRLQHALMRLEEIA